MCPEEKRRKVERISARNFAIWPASNIRAESDDVEDRGRTKVGRRRRRFVSYARTTFPHQEFLTQVHKVTQKNIWQGRNKGSRVRTEATCPALPSPSRPLKSTATIAHHNRTEVRDYCSGVGYCASLERPLYKRRGAEEEEKEREGSGGKLEGARSSGGSRFNSRTGKGTEIPEVNRLMDGGQAGSVGGAVQLISL